MSFDFDEEIRRLADEEQERLASDRASRMKQASLEDPDDLAAAQRTAKDSGTFPFVARDAEAREMLDRKSKDEKLDRYQQDPNNRPLSDWAAKNAELVHDQTDALTKFNAFANDYRSIKESERGVGQDFKAARQGLDNFIAATGRYGEDVLKRGEVGFVQRELHDISTREVLDLALGGGVFTPTEFELADREFLRERIRQLHEETEEFDSGAFHVPLLVAEQAGNILIPLAKQVGVEFGFEYGGRLTGATLGRALGRKAGLVGMVTTRAARMAQGPVRKMASNLVVFQDAVFQEMGGMAEESRSVIPPTDDFPMNHPYRLMIVMSAGVLAGSAEMLGQMVTRAPIKRALTFDKAVRKQFRELLADRGAIGMAKEIAWASGEEGATEGLQESFAIIAINWQEVLAGSKSREEALRAFMDPNNQARIWESMQSGALVGGTINSVGQGIDTLTDEAVDWYVGDNSEYTAIETATQNEKFMAELDPAMNEMEEFRKRDIGATIEAINASGENGGVESVKIPAAALNIMHQEGKLDIEDVFNSLPKEERVHARETYKNGLETGGDVEISLGAYAVHILKQNPAAHEALMPHIRLRENDYTRAEANDQMIEVKREAESASERSKRIVTQETQFEKDRDALEQDMFKQLQQANIERQQGDPNVKFFREADLRVQAKVHATSLMNQARRGGLTLQQLQDTAGALRVRGFKTDADINTLIQVGGQLARQEGSRAAVNQELADATSELESLQAQETGMAPEAAATPRAEASAGVRGPLVFEKGSGYVENPKKFTVDDVVSDIDSTNRKGEAERAKDEFDYDSTEDVIVLYHSGDKSIADAVHFGTEPNRGEWVREVLEGATDEQGAIDAISQEPAVTFLSDAPDWVVSKVARKLGKNNQDVTLEDVREHGHLAVFKVDADADVVRAIDPGEEGFTNATGRESYERWHETPLYSEGDVYTGEGRLSETPFGVERGDYFTTESVSPEYTLTGDGLVEFLQRKGVPLPEAPTPRAAPSALTAAQERVQTLTAQLDALDAEVFGSPAFRAWFGESEVVDENGMPLQMSHSTNVNFEVFKPFSHFGTAQAAEDREDALRSFSEEVGRDHAESRTERVYLSIKNALRMPDLATVNQFGEVIEDIPIEDRRQFDEDEDPEGRLRGGSFESIDNDDLRIQLLNMGVIDIDEFEATTTEDGIIALLEEKGYDGIVYENAVEDEGSDSYIAFRPEQVKSVDSSGFDAADPRFLFQSDKDAAPDRNSRGANNPDRVSARLPTGLRKEANDQETGIASLAVSLDAMIRAKDSFKKNMKLVREYNGFAKVQGESDIETANRFVRELTDNLLSLYDRIDPEVRERAKLWYTGARNVTERWSEEFGQDKHAVAGVIAALSPQKDWFENASLAERIMTVWRDNQADTFSDEMRDAAARLFTTMEVELAKKKTKAKRDGKKAPTDATLRKFNMAVADIDGLTLAEAADIGPYFAGVWIRLHDEVNASRSVRVLSPEGDFGDFVTNQDGSESRIRWQTYGAVSHAVSILMDPSMGNVSDQLGDKHKVRSFYNNILTPDAGLDVTIDTHAVAAARLLPLAGASTEVSHNFGTGAGVSSNQNVGISGTYGLYADAYRAAAAARGVLPREMQSVTWEAARALFPAAQKAQKKYRAKFAKIWAAFENGTITQEEARGRVYGIAGNIAAPEWFQAGRDNRSTEDSQASGDAGELSGSVRPGQRSERTAARGVGVDATARTSARPAGARPLFASTPESRLAAKRRRHQGILGLRKRLRSRIAGRHSGETPGPYARADQERPRRSRLLGKGVTYIKHEPTEETVDALEAVGLKAPDMLELDGPNKGQRYHDAIAAAAATIEHGAAVMVKSPEEYQGMRLYVTSDLEAGAAQDGDDMVSLFSTGADSSKGSAIAMQLLRMQGGAKRLDAFDTVLPDMYSQLGFRVRARLKWDDAQAPKGWSKETFKRWNNGEPDVLFMVYDPDNETTYAGQQEGEYFDTYDEAQAAQLEEVARIWSARRSAGLVDAGGNDIMFQSDGSALNLNAEPETVFFSKMRRFLATLKSGLPNKGTGHAVAKIIKGHAKKGKFKQMEMDDSGIIEWLEEEFGDTVISREAVAKFDGIDLHVSNNIPVNGAVARHKALSSKYRAAVKERNNLTERLTKLLRLVGTSGPDITDAVYWLKLYPPTVTPQMRGETNRKYRDRIAGTKKGQQYVQLIEEATDGADDITRAIVGSIDWNQLWVSAQEVRNLGEEMTQVEQDATSPYARKWAEYSLLGGHEGHGSILLRIPPRLNSPMPPGWELLRVDAELASAYDVEAGEWVVRNTNYGTRDFSGAKRDGRPERIWIAPSTASRISATRKALEEIKSLGGLADPQFDSGIHWSHKNVVVYARRTIRKIQGGLATMVEEFQGDWHQQGRKAHYQGQVYTRDQIDNIAAREDFVWRIPPLGAPRTDVLVSQKVLVNYASDSAITRLTAIERRQDATNRRNKHLNRALEARGMPLLPIDERLAQDFRGTPEPEIRMIEGRNIYPTLENEALVDSGQLGPLLPLEPIITDDIPGFTPDELQDIRLASWIAVPTGDGRFLVMDADNRTYGAIPKAPFRTAWPMLMFKRMLRSAVDEGHQAITWTTGQQQWERWSLRSVVKRATWTPANSSARGDRKVRFFPMDGHPTSRFVTVNGNGIIVSQDRGEEFIYKHIEQVAGEELGREIMSDASGSWDGEGRKIGGHGMEFFYDVQMVKEVNKWLKKMGFKGVKVEKITVETPKGFSDVGTLARYVGPAPVERASVADPDGRPPFREVLDLDMLDLKLMSEGIIFVEPNQIKREEFEADARRRVNKPSVYDSLSAAEGEELASLQQQYQSVPSPERHNRVDFIPIIDRIKELQAKGQAMSDEDFEVAFNRYVETHLADQIDDARHYDESKRRHAIAQLAETRLHMREENATFVDTMIALKPRVLLQLIGGSVMAAGGRARESTEVWGVRINDEMRESVLAGMDMYLQPGDLTESTEAKPAPKGFFAPGATAAAGNTIGIGATADLSTFLHEAIGHYSIHVMGALADRADASQQIKDDYAKLLKFAGVEEGKPIVDKEQLRMALAARRVAIADNDTQALREAEAQINFANNALERLARAAETYLRTGIAPSVELRDTFERMQVWLFDIYKTLRNLLGKELPSDISEVFDRIFATDAEIARARSEHKLTPMLGAKPTGMSDDRWRRYQDKVIKHNALARGVFLQRKRREEVRVHKLKQKAEKDGLAVSKAEELSVSPIHQVRQWLADGTWIGSEETRPAFEELFGDAVRGKLDFKELTEQFGERVIRELPRGRNGVVTGRHTQGLPHWEVAQLFGMTPQELIDGLKVTPTFKRAVLDAVRASQAESELTFEQASDLALQSLHEAGAELIIDDIIYAREERAKAPVTRQAQDDVADGPAGAPGDRAEDVATARAELDAAESELEAARELGDEGLVTEAGALVLEADKSLQGARDRAQAAIPARRAERNAIRQVSNTTLLQRTVRARAEQDVREQPLGTLKPDRNSSAERRAVNRAQRAVAAKDWDALIEAKADQLYHHFAYRAAQKAISRKDKIQTKVRAISRAKHLEKVKVGGIEFYNHVLGMAIRSGLIKTVREVPESEQDIEAFAKSLEEDDNATIAFDASEVRLILETKPHWRKMSLEQLEELHRAIVNLDHLAVEGQKLFINKKRITVNDFVKLVDANTRAKWGVQKVNAPFDPDAPPTAHTPFGVEKLKEGVRYLHSWMVKAESWAQTMDFGEEGGPMWQFFGNAAREAQHRENEINGDWGEDIQGVFDVYTRSELRDMARDQIHVPEVQRTFTMEEILMVALNSGNTYQRQAMMNGFRHVGPNFQPWGEPQLQAVLAKLEGDPRHLDTVHRIWAMLEKRWPMISDHQLAQTGIAPEKIQHDRFTLTSGAVLEGGYIPLKRDPQWSVKAARQEDTRALNQQFGGSATGEQTTHGFTTGRRNFGKNSVLLDFSVLFQHMNDVSHDTAQREFVTNAMRIIRHPDFDRLVRDISGGQMLETLESWVRNIAGDTYQPLDPFSKMMKQARIGANGSIIGFSMTTAAVQPVAITNAMLKVGVGPVMKSLKQYILHGGESIDYAMENSQELPQRMRNRDREVAELMSKLKRDGGLLSDAQQWGYYMIARTDMYTAAMSWQAAVTYGMNELPSPSTKSMGMTEEEAQQYGDSVLAQTQGAGAAKDMSRLQSYPSEMVKSLTVFYTYWGAMFDLNERLIRDAWQFKKEPLSRIKWVNMMFWWGVVVPAITDWILGRDDDCGDEPLAGCVAKNLFWSGLGNYASMLPGGNQLVRAIKSERQVRGFELGTGQRVVTEAFTGLAAGAGVLAPPDNATRAEQALEFAEHMGKAVWMYKGMPGLVQADRLRKTLVMMHNEEDITWRRPLFGRQ